MGNERESTNTRRLQQFLEAIPRLDKATKIDNKDAASQSTLLQEL